MNVFSIVTHAQKANIVMLVRMDVNHVAKTNTGIIFLVFAMKDGIKIVI